MSNKKVMLVLVLLLAIPMFALTIFTTQNKIKKNANINIVENKKDDVPKKQEQQQSENKETQISNNLVVWGPGKDFNEKNQPVANLKLQEKYKKYNASFIGEDSDKSIYLTFDNGYENGYTAKILDVLKDKNVKAVFFLTYDYVKDNDELVKRMIDEGHIIGNHTYYHSSLPKVSEEKAFANIKKQDDYVKEKFNIDMNLFRFPMGEFSEKTLKMAQDMGYKSMFWSFAYKDWDESHQSSNQKSLDALKKGLHNGAIYLLHSVSKVNSEILGDFIDYTINEGYKFKTMN